MAAADTTAQAGRRAGFGLRGALVLAVAGAFSVPQPGLAQMFSLGTASPVRTLDQERLFLESQFGRRVQREIDAASRALAAQNEELQSRLVAEELSLAERRPTLPAAEFRRLADAFDARVTQIRTEQEARARAIAQLRDRERQRFFEAALPVLAQVLRESGAVAIIDSRTVILASEQLDITDLALFMLDQRLGDGSPPGATPPAEGLPTPDGNGAAGAGGGAGGTGNGRNGPGAPVTLPLGPPAQTAPPANLP
jgi:Skp family chaperone for outer membrane proteins